MEVVYYHAVQLSSVLVFCSGIDESSLLFHCTCIGVIRGGAPPPLDDLNVVKKVKTGEKNVKNSGSAPLP